MEKEYRKCNAKATSCVHKRNSDIGIEVCGMPGIRDGQGCLCPFEIGLKVLIEDVPA